MTPAVLREVGGMRPVLVQKAEAQWAKDSVEIKARIEKSEAKRKAAEILLLANVKKKNTSIWSLRGFIQLVTINW